MDESFDAIVIGGGPAGSSFAFSAARLGKKVALFEKDSVPGRKVCGGVLSPKCWKAIQKLGMEPAVMDLPFQELRYLLVEVGSGHELKIPFPQGEIPSRVIDRSVFDAALWKFAESRGVFVYDKTIVKELAPQEDEWSVRVSHHKDLTFRSKILIGADGRNSFVARQLGLKAKCRQKTVCYQYRLKSHDFDREGVHFFIFNNGYCGLSVDGTGCAHLDVLSLKGCEGDKEIMERLLNHQSRFVEKLRRAEFYSERPLARSPIGSGRRSFPTQKNVFLLGDAQQWFEPFTGEGIRLALESSLDSSAMFDDCFNQRRILSKISRTNWLVSQLLKSPVMSSCFVSCLKYIPSLARSLAKDVLE